MRTRDVGWFFALVLGACSSGGYASHDGAAAPHDFAVGEDLAGKADLAEAADAASGGCITSLECDARTTDHGCGVTTPTGQRYPDQGAPYCMGDKMTRQGCSCDLVRCSSVLPLCPGIYQAVFTERLISGCSGVVNDKGGTCNALWNTIETSPGSMVLLDGARNNMDLDWAFVDYQQAFKVTTASVVQVKVQQYCLFQDVMGLGNAGRSEVKKISITLQ